MRERLTHIGIIAWAALVEAVRRKDLYVVWMLAVFGIGAGGVLSLVGVRGIETFLRDITLTVVNFLSVTVCIWLAARQIAEELSRRTLFPLLARPVRRVDVLLGKFVAVWLLSCGALCVLAGTAWCVLAAFNAAIGPIFLEYIALRMLSFGPIIALTMTLSLLMSPPATVVLSGLLTLCATLFARTLGDLVLAAPPGAQWFLKLVYFLVPHFDLFDLSQMAAYDYPLTPAWVVLTLFAYAVGYVIVFLGLGSLRFRRMAV
jgi:ABC-type transport system involved in multi-copper enzyme maturation permease subunit